MVVFLIRQLVFLKRAILGRRQPHQLAGGLALGVWLAMVPPGNLLSLLILLAILALRINQGMAALSAVLMSVVAARLDTHTDALGRFVLTHPNLAEPLATLWQWPLVPWTDLNNTVVMGGLLAGMASLPPSYLIGYLVFSKLAPPASEPSAALAAESQTAAASLPQPGEPLPHAEQAVQQTLAAPQGNTPAAAPAAAAAAAEPPADQLREAPPQPAASIPEATPAMQTRPLASPSTGRPPSPECPPGPDRPQSEALNYLLHQLRQSRQGRAA